MRVMKTVPNRIDMIYSLAHGPLRTGEMNAHEVEALKQLEECGYAHEINGYHIITANGMIVALNLGVR